MSGAGGFLADTNVVSERAAARPNPKVVAWTAGALRTLFISAVVVGEIHRGVENLPLNSPKRARLAAWLAGDVEGPLFAGRILPMDSAVAKTWLALTDKKEMEAADSVIAATALTHGLVLATRNIRHFREIPGLKIFNPWDLP